MVDETRSMDLGDREVDKIIDRLCATFDRCWQQDNDYRVQSMLDDVKRELSEESDQRLCIRELLFCEIDLRFNAKMPIDRGEYYRDYPGFENDIDEAIERVVELSGSYDPIVDPLVAVSISEDPAAQQQEAVFLDPDGNDRIPGKIGPYVEIIQIGFGGYGVVCKAVDSRNSRRVALKFPRKTLLKTEEQLQRFWDEAQKSIPLDHPRIVRTYAIENIDGFLFIVQQLVDGVDLKERMAKGISQRDATRLIAEIADALSYAHQQGIYHRDIKPSNILLDADGNPHLADFGLAIASSELYEEIGQQHGTIPYMPPETITGRVNFLTGCSDIWSLGVMFYELLAGERPFGGTKRQIIFDEIQHKDPPPIRERHPHVAAELERICLNCLEKRVRDRPQTANDLARELKTWLVESENAATRDKTRPTDSPTQQFVPRGLQAYREEDHDFFLQLLPGPKDNQGHTRSIRDWIARIVEPIAEDRRTPVGVVYGPSGSGKSSFVRAGLVPLVDDDVDVFYVEATRDDTEARLLSALRNKYTEIPKTDIPDVFKGLRVGAFQPQSKQRKALIVLDQFEQWLAANDYYEQAQLAQALAHCDGENLQVILLVRDDFWMRLTRLMDVLEVDLGEGVNAQAIDLFDHRHARKVLRMLGEAYGVSRIDDDFLDAAIKELSVEGYVICVRLTLFAEMLKKEESWTAARVGEFGKGIGKQFLEETFGPNSRRAKCKDTKDDVQKLLGVLVPDAGTDIRGNMKRESELIAQSGLPVDRAKSLIRILSSDDLRLITQTDPNRSSMGDVEPTSTATQKDHDRYFQLTHDFLVHSIRDWIHEDLGKTRAGRARIRLRQLAADVHGDHRPENLPTNFEWLSWQYFLRGHRFTENERTVMRYGRRQFMQSFSMASTVVLLLGLLTAVFVSNAWRRARAESVLRDLSGLEFDELPGVVDRVKDVASIVRPTLVEWRDSSNSNAELRRRAMLGLLPLSDDPHGSVEVAKNVLNPNIQPDELSATLDVLQEYGDDFAQEFKDSLDLGDNESSIRFRAAVALARTNTFVDWTNYAGLIGSALIGEPVTTHQAWIDFLAPIADHLNPKFQEIFLQTDDPDAARAMAMGMYAFTEQQDRANNLAGLLFDSNEYQFDAVLTAFEQQQDKEALVSAVRSLDPGENYRNQAERAIALLRLDEPDNYMQILGDLNNPGARSYAIIYANDSRVDFNPLRSMYELHERKMNDYFRQGLLLAFAERVDTLRAEEHIRWLDDQSRYACENDQDAGCFSAAELIVRRRSITDSALKNAWIRFRSNRLASSTQGKKGRVLINTNLLAFSIIKFDENKSLAVATSEVTNGALLSAGFDIGKIGFDERINQKAYRIHNLSIAFEFCNWMTEKDNLANQIVYPKDSLRDYQTISVDAKRRGYRLMTHQEWLTICDGERGMAELGKNYELSEYYAWTLSDADAKLQDCCQLLPNRHGLFDVYGNAFEFCTSQTGSDIEYWAMGRSCMVARDTISPTRIFDIHDPKYLSNSDPPLEIGLRPVRQLSP